MSKAGPTILIPEEFWKLVAASKLIDQGMLKTLQREFEAIPPATERLPQSAAQASPGVATAVIAEWLVKREVLSLWQARRLARGEHGPYFIDDYRLEERLECDGSSLLFRARHDPSGRNVCLVLLNSALCKRLEVWTEVVRRTTIANQAADAMLSRTWALEQTKKYRFIICEDISGRALADELACLGPLTPTQAAPLMLALAQAVALLHRMGTVHGAVSLDTLRREPVENGQNERTGNIRLLQFPLGVDPHLVPQRVPTDTPEMIQRLARRASFLAPELMLPGGVCDARSDVYAIGCVFHSLLTGSLACWQKDPQHTLSQAALVGPAPLRPPLVPVAVASLIATMVARDPAVRYATASEAAAAIATCFGLPNASGVLPPQAPPLAPQVQAIAVAAMPAVDFTAGLPNLQDGALWSGTPPPKKQALETALQAATLAARRRATRLHRIGLAVTGLLLTVAVVCVISLSLPDKQEQPKTTNARPSPTQAVKKPTGPAIDPLVAPVDADKDAGKMVTPSSPATPEVSPPAVNPAREKEIVAPPAPINDPRLPWASPTNGRPPALEYLLPGSQLILLARPADIMENEEGRLFVRSLGPGAEQAVQALARICGCELKGIEVLQVGWQAGGSDEVISGSMLRLVEPMPTPIDSAEKKNTWGDTSSVVLKGETIYKGASLSYWLPTAEQGHVLVTAPESAIREMIESGRDVSATEGIQASLPRDLEVLVGMLDRKRHLTLLGSPSYLLNDGRAVMAGPFAKLVEPLGDFFGKSAGGAALSLHFGDNFYIEIDTVATLTTPAKILTQALAGKIEALADQVETYCTNLNPHPYGRKLVLRLPAMIRILAANTRSGAEGKGVVLNGYLPQHAGHNLVLAAELALEQSPGAVGGLANSSAATPKKEGDSSKAAQGALQKLQKKISLTFARDTLEKSVQMLSEETGTAIEIQGPDLQLEGITKNQSFALEERDQTADAILRKILAKSNTDGKLVYVVRTKDGVESIDITTRAAVAKRGDKLPPGFEAPKVEEKPAGTKK